MCLAPFAEETIIVLHGQELVEALMADRQAASASSEAALHVLEQFTSRTSLQDRPDTQRC